MWIHDDDVLTIVDDRMAMGHPLDEALDWVEGTAWARHDQVAGVRAHRGPITAPPPVCDVVDDGGPWWVRVAAAVDAGYRIVVALAGPASGARDALQAHLDSEVVASNRARWFVLTGGADVFRAFGQNAPDPMLADLPHKRLLIVSPGTAAALGELQAWFAGTTPRYLAESPVLVVDAASDDAAAAPLVEALVAELSGRTQVGRVQVKRAGASR